MYLQVLLLALIFAMVGCSTNPASGKSQILLLGSKKEEKIGAKLYQEILKDEKLYDNAEWDIYINLLGKEIASNSDWPDQEFKFFILESADVNAFALPNAYIFITTGMLMHLNKESHLAAVLAHEIAHVTARHTARKLTRNTLLSGISQPLSIAAWSVPGLGLIAGSKIDSQLALKQTVLLKGYGRELELQADKLGARYLAASGYQPEDMLEVLGILKEHEEYRRDQVTQEASREFEIGVSYHASNSDTHPSADTRLQEVIQAAESFLKSDEVRQNRENYLLMVDGLAVTHRQRYAMDPDWAKLVTIDSDVDAYIPFTFEPFNRDDQTQSPSLLLPSASNDASYIAVDSSHKVFLDAKKKWASKYSNNALLFYAQDKPVNRNPKEFLLEFINERAQDIQYLDNREVSSRFGDGYYIRSKTSRLFKSSPLSADSGKIAKAEHHYGVIFLEQKAVVVVTYGGVFDFDVILHAPLFISILKNIRTPSADRMFDDPIGRQTYQVALKKVLPGDTFNSLASEVLIENAEQKLRLINGMYPRGEPQVGDEIKVFSTSK